MELMDMVGLDICNKVGEELDIAPKPKKGSKSKATKKSTAKPDNVLAALVKQGKLGKKTGEGFYVWADGKPKREEASYDDAELDRLGAELIKPMLDEAERAAADKVVESADHVDAGVIFGTGFAPFRGGPLHYRHSTDARASDKAAA
jgi:3-hydroxyacyl-CoA dehydrogenase/enoyl-CoA hydratase/3-hydroxybutyryl-CoA epimerase